MPRWLLKSQRKLFDVNDENNGGWGWDKDTSNSDTSKNWEGKNEEGKKTPENIPYDRFKEVNDANKALKEKLAEYEKKEAEEAEKKRLADEEEAKKKGEFEKLLTQKDQELADLKKQQESWKAREEAQVKRNDERIEALAKKFWDEWGNVKNLIEWFTDPFVLSDKISTLENMSVKSSQWWQAGGSKVPSGGNMSRKQELMDKLNSGKPLSAKEQNELLTLTSWNS